MKLEIYHEMEIDIFWQLLMRQLTVTIHISDEK